MKTSILITLLFILLIFSSCVSVKQYNDLNDKLEVISSEKENLETENLHLLTSNKELKSENSRLKEQNIQLQDQYSQLEYEFELYERRLANLSDENSELHLQIESLQTGSSQEIRDLLEELHTARADLNEREDKLREAEKELEERNSRLIELEAALLQKEEAVQELKNKVANALVGFNNQGLSVYEKDGNVYVSLEERLLFKTGQWDVDPRGQEALKELAIILAQNPDINIMVEGHTDDVPMNGSGAVKDNWDLSVMRATAVTKIITQNQGVDPKRIIAAGRSEYVPIDNEKTPDGRQKNRRTEIILTPRISELLEILGTN